MHLCHKHQNLNSTQGLSAETCLLYQSVKEYIASCFIMMLIQQAIRIGSIFLLKIELRVRFKENLPLWTMVKLVGPWIFSLGYVFGVQRDKYGRENSQISAVHQTLASMLETKTLRLLTLFLLNVKLVPINRFFSLIIHHIPIQIYWKCLTTFQNKSSNISTESWQGLHLLETDWKCWALPTSNWWEKLVNNTQLLSLWPELMLDRLSQAGLCTNLSGFWSQNSLRPWPSEIISSSRFFRW